MALSALQKIGIALGFIPGVSTIVGAIKAFVYFRRVEKHEKDLNQINAVEISANNIHQKALHIFKEQDFREISHLEKDIGKWSIAEMIPGVNILVAFAGVVADEGGYPALSKAQQNIKEISSNSEDRFKNYLMQRYGVKDNPNPVLIGAMEWIFANLDDPSRNIILNTDNKAYILNQIPELVSKCKEKSLTETDSKKVLANALKEIIDKRKEDEEIVKMEDRRMEAFRHLGYYSQGQIPTNHLKWHMEGTQKLQDLLLLVSS